MFVMVSSNYLSKEKKVTCQKRDQKWKISEKSMDEMS